MVYQSQTLDNALNELEIDLFEVDFKILFNHMHFFEYIYTMSHFPSNSFKTSAKKYLNDSYVWYDFVVKLCCVFSLSKLSDNV